jgi:8-oxo-dGTP pyrophosphatase MutT (NUDIX family)
VTAATLDLDTVRDRIARYEPDARPERSQRGWQAATALVVAPGDEHLEIAFILRHRAVGRPVVGADGAPGRQTRPEDDDLAATAVRETREEVGLALPGPVGRLDDQGGRVHRGVVATYVFVLDERHPMTPHPGEVAEALWIPLPALFAPQRPSGTGGAGCPSPASSTTGASSGADPPHPRLVRRRDRARAAPPVTRLTGGVHQRAPGPSRPRPPRPRPAATPPGRRGPTARR